MRGQFGQVFCVLADILCFGPQVFKIVELMRSPVDRLLGEELIGS